MKPPLELPVLSSGQQVKLQAFEQEALALNRRINLYSAESAADFYRRHILHSLAIASLPISAGSEVVDWGTGGGLPGLPLAIALPEVRFHLVDAVEKKVRAVQTMTRRLGLANVQVHHARAETWPGQVALAVSRATAPLLDLWEWTARVLKPAGGEFPRLICLKGGDLADEIAALRTAAPGVRIETVMLEPLLGDPYFREKVLLAVTADFETRTG